MKSEQRSSLAIPSTLIDQKKLQRERIKIRRVNETIQSILLGGGVICLLLAVWEWMARIGAINTQFSSSPTLIVKMGAKLFKSGEIWPHVLASGKIFLSGYILAVIFGIPIGILLGWFRKANKAFGPIVAAFYTTPRIALMPLFIIWFGIGMGSKVALVFLSAVFPVIVNMQMAMQNWIMT